MLEKNGGLGLGTSLAPRTSFFSRVLAPLALPLPLPCIRLLRMQAIGGFENLLCSISMENLLFHNLTYFKCEIHNMMLRRWRRDSVMNSTPFCFHSGGIVIFLVDHNYGNLKWKTPYWNIVVFTVNLIIPCLVVFLPSVDTPIVGLFPHDSLNTGHVY